MNAKKLLGPSSFAFLALVAMLAYSEPPQAVLNVRQAGGMDLDLDLDSLEDDLAGSSDEDVADTIEIAEDAVEDATDELLDDALDAADEAVEDVTDAADEAVEDVADAADEALDAADEAVEDVADAADEAVEDVADAADEAVEDVADAADEAVEDVADAADEAVEDVADAADEAVEDVADAADEAVEEVADAADEAVEEVEDAADEAVEEVADAADEAVEEVEDAADEAVEEVADAADEAVEEIDAVDEVVEDVADAADEEAGEFVDDESDLIEEAVEEAPVEDDGLDAVAEDAPADGEIDELGDNLADPDDDLIDLDAVAGAAAPADPMAKPLSEISELERARRKLLIDHGFDCVRQGQNLLAVGSWDHANEKFDEALRFLVPLDMETTHGAIEEATRGKAEAYYRIADDQVEARAYDEALKNLRLSRQLGHPKANERYNEVTKLQREPPPVPPPPKVRMWNDETYKAMRKKIDERMGVAKEYYACGLYTDCRREVELLLYEFPWCDEALSLLRRLATREHQYVDEERRTTRENMIRGVTEKWTPRTYGVNFVKGDNNGVKVPDGADAAQGNAQDLSVETKIRQKMNNIVIPEIEFRQANIADVISFLGDASREYDEDDVPASERGVNFVLDIGDVGGGDGGASDDGFGGGLFDTPSEPAAASGGGIPLLTIKSHYVTLLSTLDLIMDMAGLKYRIQGNVVKIMPKNKADGTLIHRMYNVLPSIDQHINTIGGGGSGSGDSGDPFALQSGTSEGTSDWKGFFGQLGVNWPDGSSVKYMPQIGKLVVMNTADNLATLEQVLGALNVTPFQVEIEVRFVEVGQTDLNSLGLEWILNDNYEITEKRNDAWLPAQSRRRLVMEKGNFTGGFNFLPQNTRETINNGGGIADNIATFTSILSNPELSVVLHALANKTNADLLSAPKVVAQTGAQATIKSVVEYIYPTEYDVQMLESENSNDSSTYTGAVVEPQNFQTREVGVILQVTPRVSSDGSRISLDMTPSVVSIPTWKNYGSTYPVYGDQNLITGQRQVEYVQLNMEQPFFPVRSLATSVDIYNGSTVVMGGMITEERYSEEDKIPILGDIPILGRLFRYQYDQSEKKNLLIFVSARLVDPAGRTISGAGAAPWENMMLH
jgi:general secretion pathway protein D